MTADDFHWYAAIVKRQRERAVCGLLRCAGMIGYVPRETCRVKVGRRPTRWEDREVPIIRGLVFVGALTALQADAYAWRGVIDMDHVRYLVGDIDGPRPIPVRQIRAMLDARGEREAEMLKGDLPAYQPGEKVRMTAGAFEGLPATVRELRGRRAVILAKLLGGEREIEIDAADLEPMAAE